MRELVLKQIRQAAHAIGLPLIEVETNIRDFSDDLRFSWEEQHGAALAAVAHFLAPAFTKVFIPSSYALPFLTPFGSHPGLDPLWSSPNLELVHDGLEATRFDKVGALCSWDTALTHMRVCWRLVEGQYNCCQCRKCLWTMAFLRAYGVLDRATSFPLPIDLQRLSEQPASATEHRYRLICAIGMLNDQGDDPDLMAALQAALKQPSWWRRAVGQLSAFWYRRVRRTLRTGWHHVRPSATRHET